MPRKATAPKPAKSTGHSYADNQMFHARGRRGTPPAPPAVTIDALVMLGRKRRHCIVSQSRDDRSCDSFIAPFLGYVPPVERDEDDTRTAEYKAIFRRAKAIRVAGEKEIKKGLKAGLSLDEITQDAETEYFDVIKGNFLSRDYWDRLREATEARMREIARDLPAFGFVESIKGMSGFSLALITAEAGHLSKKPTSHYAGFATKERVWKRLGLAVIDGERQQKKTNKDEAAKHAFSPKRRAEMWVIADSMFKHQWTGDRDEDGVSCAKSGKPVAVPAHASGPYGQVYANRRKHTEELNRGGFYAEVCAGIVARTIANKKKPNKENLEGRKTPSHLHNDGVRIMMKAVLEDVWRVWNGRRPLYGIPSTTGQGEAKESMSTIVRVPPPIESDETRAA